MSMEVIEPEKLDAGKLIEDLLGLKPASLLELPTAGGRRNDSVLHALGRFMRRALETTLQVGVQPELTRPLVDVKTPTDVLANLNSLFVYGLVAPLRRVAQLPCATLAREKGKKDGARVRIAARLHAMSIDELIAEWEASPKVRGPDHDGYKLKEFPVYDELIRAFAEKRVEGPLVISNSYGLARCQTGGLPQDHPFMGAVLAAVDRGIFVCFAAGNNHSKLCGHEGSACGPNSIWGPNSHDRVFCVGAINRDDSNCDPGTPHVNSSRGPGEWAVETVKPDCVAPTYGEVPWGSTYRRMQWWGTSGACPQVAGAAALVLSVAPKLTPRDVADVIKGTCSLLSQGRT